MEEITVRLATENDIPQIVCLANAFTPTSDENQNFRLKLLRETFAEKGHEIYVVDCDDKIVAFMEIRKHVAWFPTRLMVYIEYIYVYPTYRRRGIGKKMINHLKTKYADNEGLPHKWIYAEGIVDGFYEKAGVGIRPNIHFYLSG